MGFTGTESSQLPASDPNPVVDIAEPAGITKPPPADPVIETEVGGTVETPPAQASSPGATTGPELALTGPSDNLPELVAVGVALMTLGVLLLGGRLRYARADR